MKAWRRTLLPGWLAAALVCGLLTQANAAPEARPNADWIAYPSWVLAKFDSEENRTDPDPMLRWQTPVVTISAPASRIGVLREAIAEWQGPGLPRLRIVDPERDPDIAVQDVQVLSRRDPDMLGETEPVAEDPPPLGPPTTYATVSIKMTTGLSPAEYRIVLTHELGHALGFWRHAANPHWLMGAELSSEQSPHVSAAERALLAQLYALPRSTQQLAKKRRPPLS
jgi:hypothetical protein